MPSWKKLIASGSDAALNSLSVTTSVTADSFVKSGGTSSQFLKADGSVDISSYVSSSQINITSGQVAFGTGVNTIGGDSGLTWDNVNKWVLITNGTNLSTRYGVNGISFLRDSTSFIGNYTTNGAIDIYATTFIKITGNSNIDFLTGGSGTPRMTIPSTGNVLIGTTTDAGEKFQVNGNALITNALISNQENLDVDSAAAEVVAQVSSTTYTAVFFDYSIKNGTNVRAGTVYATHDGTNVVYTETSTADLGDTSGVELSVDLNGGNLRLLATVTTDNWIVKSLIRGL